jgi:serine/threonine-protein kinase RsbW
MTRFEKPTAAGKASKPRLLLPELISDSGECAGSALDVNIVLKLRSDARYLSLIRGIAVDVCRNLGLTHEATDGVKLAVGEAVANAMEHGSPNGKHDSVVVIFTKAENSLKIEVVDEGPGVCFPIDRRRCRRRNRGFGMILMRSLMDTVEYLPVEKGTHLVMTKRLPS